MDEIIVGRDRIEDSGAHGSLGWVVVLELQWCTAAKGRARQRYYELSIGTAQCVGASQDSGLATLKRYVASHCLHVRLFIPPRELVKNPANHNSYGGALRRNPITAQCKIAVTA